MLLQEPDESPYDVRFSLLGFPIRIAWTFWLGAAVFGYPLVEMLDRSAEGISPGRLPLLLLWALCLLVSIVIHELGHALAFRRFGIESSVVLYHFGGLAIPLARRSGRGFNERGFSGGGFASSLSLPRLSNTQDLWIALAGPLAQLLSALAVVAVIKAMSYRIDAFALMPWPLDQVPGVLEGQPLDSFGLRAMAIFYIFPSVLWAFLNLVPVFPLDGGRVMRSLVLMTGGRQSTWLYVSLITAGVCAYAGFTGGQLFMGILFVSLAMGNYQMLQSTMGN